MVASADMSHLGKLLDRVDELNNVPQLSDIRVTFEEFKHVAELRRKLEPFSLALFSFGEVKGLLTRKDFQRAASQVRYFLFSPCLFDFPILVVMFVYSEKVLRILFV